VFILYFVGLKISKHKKWLDEEVKDLLMVWKKNYSKSMEESKRKGFTVTRISYAQYKSMAKSLQELGHKVTTSQCIEKTKVLAYHYRRVSFFSRADYSEVNHRLFLC